MAAIVTGPFWKVVLAVISLNDESSKDGIGDVQNACPGSKGGELKLQQYSISADAGDWADE